ncbi:beta-carotene 15,15'-dioxygenase, Brp/Blh family [Wenzhouxiangella sp. XN79A]|uniref:Brp/Blh family beta-carotene 15,15'-dioxygenase n=1 Tax=Wenzhouxiangella sp. XN79A TaxID=2724193 RepID=UPI00144AC718|nr:Brp/Blh family beta-carotene 15,15'-dioxygenase [Wenzhouxiangella sp. XN79A]NKI34985.1 beta-carotene 15,15'-dioxygenase, Brp/Blh family [Wenzhouxiangella sp. XN79A]
MSRTTASLAVDPSLSSGRRSWQRLHGRIALILMAAMLPLAEPLAAASIVDQLYLVLVPIALLGILHGGADPWVGRALTRALGVPRPRASFYATYIALMATVLLAWWWFPLTTLTVFLLISIVHFGDQDATTFGLPTRPLDVMVLGSLPVLGPAVGHSGDVATLFGWLTGTSADSLESWLQAVLAPLVCLWLIGIGMVVGRVALERGRRRARRLALAVAVIALVVTRLPPLVAFAVYFCLLHSVGHLLDMATARDGPWTRWTLGQWARRLWPATLGAILFGVLGAGVLGLLQPDAAPPGADAVRVLFWGLAALTVPHVLLHAAWHRARRRGAA